MSGSTPPHPDPDQPGSFDGPELPDRLVEKLRVNVPGYALLDKIASGGQATVYRARELTSGLTVAIKVLNGGTNADPGARERLLRETATLRALNHPNIVSVIESGRTAVGLDFIVMNHVDGRRLDALWEDLAFAAAVAPEPPDRLRLFKRICDVVQVAHLKGITHRDLSPSNILITADGEPHVLDFGLASTAFDHLLSPAGRDVTVTGQFIGKVKYAAPEQARGERGRIDIRTDVYALGVILYQILTNGAFPYEVVGALVDVLNHIIHTEPLPPSSHLLGELRAAGDGRRHRDVPLLNESIEAIVLKALAKHSTDRYQSAGELGADVEQYLAGRPTTALVQRGSPEVAIRPARRAVVPVAVGIAVAIVGGLLNLFPFARQPATPTPAIKPQVRREGLATSRGTTAAIPTSKPTAPAIAGLDRTSVIAAVAATTPVQLPTTRGTEAVANLVAAKPVEAIAPPTSGPTPRQVDLLAAVLPEHDVSRGIWKWTLDGIACNGNQTAAASILRLPYYLPSAYDLSTEFTLRSFSDDADPDRFQVTIVCSVGPVSFPITLATGNDTTCYLGTSDSSSARQTLVSVADILKLGVRHRAVVQVRPDGVKVMVDGKAIIDHATDYRDVGHYGGPFDIGLNVAGLICTPAVEFHKVTINDVAGRGHLVGRWKAGPTAVPPQDPTVRTVSIADVPPLAAQGFHESGRIRGGGTSIQVHGQACTDFIHTYAPFSATYAVPAGAVGFQSTELRPNGHSRPPGALFVYVDGDEVFFHRPAGAEVMDIYVPIPRGARTLELRADPKVGNSGMACVWANPRFIVKPNAPPLQIAVGADHPDGSDDTAGIAALKATLMGYRWAWRDGGYPVSIVTFLPDGTFHDHFHWHYWVVGPHTIHVQFWNNNYDPASALVATANDDLTAITAEFPGHNIRCSRLEAIRAEQAGTP